MELLQYFTSPGWSFQATSQEHQQGVTFFSDTGCPLKVTCDSCCITAHLPAHFVTLLPKSFLDPLALDTTHDKMLVKSFICPLSHTHTIWSHLSQSSVTKMHFLLASLCSHLFFSPFLLPCLASFNPPPPLHLIVSFSSLSFSSYLSLFFFLASLKSPSQRNIHLVSKSADQVGSRWQYKTANYIGMCEYDRDVEVCLKSAL